MAVHILDVMVTACVFSHKFSALNLPYFQLQFSFDSDSATVSIRMREDPELFAAKLVITKNFIRVFRNRKRFLFSFDTQLELYANLLLICCEICGVNTREAIRATLGCLPSKVIAEITSS